ARDVWENPGTKGFFCEHLDVFSETFPTSGMTVNGAAYALPTWEPATEDSGFSSSPHVLPTPAARDWRSAGLEESHHARTQAQPLSEILHMLPTPSANLGENGRSQHPDKRRAGNHQ